MRAQHSEPPISGHYEVDFTRPLSDAGGGLETYVATDRRGGVAALMAVQVPSGQAARARPLGALVREALPFCLIPLAHGLAKNDRGLSALFVVCAAPPGPPVLAAGAGRRWPERELIELLLKPAAAALTSLQARHVTHRAIRADNVFGAPQQPVTLGCAWAASPGFRQPAVYDPPYSAICSAACRDDGVIADDVYALGVLMVALALGAEPMAELDAAEIVARKLALGSAEAVIGRARLPPMIDDLARGMLAEDPDHRPTPAMLADPALARTRRIAARPPRRAQRSIAVGSHIVWDARGLAHALSSEPAPAIQLLRSGIVDQWLRRSLADASLALVLDEAVRQRTTEAVLAEPEADAILLLRAVAMLDPLAPVCWRGFRLWPAALGTALAAASDHEETALARMIDVEAFAIWAIARAQRRDPVMAQLQARNDRALLRQRGWSGGIAALRYAGVPLLPCRAGLVRDACVVRGADLLVALNRAAERADPETLPLDAEMAAFVAVRADLHMDDEFGRMAQAGVSRPEQAVAQLRVLAKLQSRQPSSAVPALAAWLGRACAPLLTQVRGRTRVAAFQAELAQQVATGRLGGMIAVLDDPAVTHADGGEAALATARIAELDATIALTERSLAADRAAASRLGREMAASLGLMAAVVAAVLLAL